MQKQKTLDGEVIDITYHIPFVNPFNSRVLNRTHPKRTEEKHLTDYGIEV